MIDYILYEPFLLPLFYVLSTFFIGYYGFKLTSSFLRHADNYHRLLDGDEAGITTGGAPHPVLPHLLAFFSNLIKDRSIKKILQSYELIAKRVMVTSLTHRGILPVVRQYAPAVIHCHDLITLPLGARVRAATGAVLVYDSHEIYEEQGSYGLLLKVIFYILQKKYSRYADRFITINESIGDFLTTRYPKLSSPVIIKNATKKLSDRIIYDGRLHSAAGIERDVKILLYQGGFGPKRGLEILIKSAPLLEDGWCLVMMGWGSLENQLKDLSNRIDPDRKKIRFVPRVPHAELAWWTAGATVGVIPYENVNLNHWYCTPNKLWEYPNAGVPLLVSPFPEMKKTVTENKIGWLLDLNLSPANIAETLASLDNGNDEIQRASKACIDFIQKDNWLIYEKRLINLYKEILQNNAV